PTSTGLWKRRVTYPHRDGGRLEAKHFSSHDCDQRLCPCSKILCPATDLHTPIRIDPHFGFRALAPAAPGSTGTANPSFHRTLRRSRRTIFGIPPETFSSDLILLAPDLRWIVLNPQLNRVHAQSERHFIHDRFHTKRR